MMHGYFKIGDVYMSDNDMCVIQLPLYQSMIALSSNDIHFFFGQ